MTINQNGIVLESGQGSKYWVIRDLYTFKAVAEETGGTYGLIEIVMQPQGGVPLHVHSYENEAFYIQEGEVEFQLGEQTIVATAGTFLHSPKGQHHGFKNNGTTPAKMLCWVTPAGLEKFFMEVGKPVDAISLEPPEVTTADLENLIMTAQKYGLEILPPATV